MKMTLSVLLGGQGTEKYGDAPPHTLGNRTKSDASHLQQNQMPHICQPSSMKVTKKRTPPGRQQARRGKARGTTSPRGGEGPLAPQCQRSPSRSEENINTAYATSPQR